MKRLLLVIVALALPVVALPVIAEAGHKPSHTPGQPGPGQPPAPKPPAPQTDLTIAAQPAITVFRGATVISGSLKGPDNAGKPVFLRADEAPLGDGFKNVAATVTDSKGDYSFTQRPARNTTYQTFANTGVAYGLKFSVTVTVKVRIRMGLRVSDRTPRVGQIVRFRGRACPAHDGLLVKIQRKGRRGGFRTVRRTRLRAATNCSTYAKRFRVFRDGTFRVTSDDADHARGFSPTRFLNTPR